MNKRNQYYNDEIEMLVKKITALHFEFIEEFGYKGTWLVDSFIINHTWEISVKRVYWWNDWFYKLNVYLRGILYGR